MAHGSHAANDGQHVECHNRLDNLIEQKANTSDVNTALAAKADVTAMNTALGNKADVSALSGYVTTGDPKLTDKRISPDGSIVWGQLAAALIGTSVNQIPVATDARFTNERTPTDGSVTTAKVVDGAVTKAKTASAVQASLDKADTALQPAGNLAGLANVVTARENLKILVRTQSQYDAISPKDANTIYIIQG